MRRSLQMFFEIYSISVDVIDNFGACDCIGYLHRGQIKDALIRSKYVYSICVSEQMIKCVMWVGHIMSDCVDYEYTIIIKTILVGMLMGEREEDDLEPKRAVTSKTKENAESDAGLYRGYAAPGWGWPHYPNVHKPPVRPAVNPWAGFGNLGAYGIPGGFGWGGWGWGRPGLFGWLF